MLFIVAYTWQNVLYFENFFQFFVFTKYDFDLFCFCAKILIETIPIISFCRYK